MNKIAPGLPMTEEISGTLHSDNPQVLKMTRDSLHNSSTYSTFSAGGEDLYTKKNRRFLGVPLWLTLLALAVVLVVIPCGTVWAVSYNEGRKGTDDISKAFTSFIKESVETTMYSIIQEVDTFLAREVVWLADRDKALQTWDDYEDLRVRYMFSVKTNAVNALYLRSSNYVLVCSGDPAGMSCAQKMNATDSLNFYYVDPKTGELLSLYGKTSGVYNSYARVKSDVSFSELTSGRVTWGKIGTTTAGAPAIVVSSYHPYLSTSGALLGVVQGSKTLQTLSYALTKAAGDNYILFVQNFNGSLIASSVGSIMYEEILNNSGVITKRWLPLAAVNSSDHVISSIAREIQNRGGCQNIRSDEVFNAASHLFVVSQMHNNVSLYWCVVAALPADQIYGTIDKGNRISIAVFASCTFLSVVIGLVVVLLVILPLRLLSKDMRLLSELTFAPLKKGISVFYEMQSMMKDYLAMKKAIHAFSHYISADVVRLLLRGNDKMLTLALKRRKVTVLFMDVVGFTTLCEKMPPDDLIRLMGNFMGRMCNILLARGATLDKFIGDCIMAFWNQPVEQIDHEFVAVQAVLECFRELVVLNEENRKQDLPEVYFRAGINAGPVLIGNFGAPQRFDYTVVGDVVNIAARLEQKNKELGTWLLISKEVQDRLGDRVETTCHGEMEIRGREAKVEVYSVEPPVPMGQSEF